MSIQKNHRLGSSFAELRSFRDGKNTVKAINRYLSGVQTAAVDTLRREESQPHLSRLYSETNKFLSLKQVEENEKTQEINRLRKEVEEQRTIIQLQDELILKLMGKIERKESSQTINEDFPSNERAAAICEKLRLTRQLLERMSE